MKNLLLLLSLGILCGSLAFAQDTSTAGQTPASSDSGANASAVQGCLSGSDGNYMLTQDGTGTTYKLVGDEGQLKKHVGHEVAVTGQPASSTGSSAASATDQGQSQPSAGSSDSPALQVATVKMISKQCGSAGSAPQSR